MFKKIFFLLSLIIVSACSNDSNSSGMKIKYRASSDPGVIISEVIYRAPEGGYITTNSDNPYEYNKEINITPPYNAYMSVKVNNTNNESKYLHLYIYKNGTLNREVLEFAPPGENTYNIESYIDQ